jgi:hypothetical protein
MKIRITINFDPQKDWHDFLVWIFKWLLFFAKKYDAWQIKKLEKRKEEREKAEELMQGFRDWNVSCGRAPDDFGEENIKAIERCGKRKIIEKFGINLGISFPVMFIAMMFFGVYSSASYAAIIYSSISLLAHLVVLLKNS